MIKNKCIITRYVANVDYNERKIADKFFLLIKLPFFPSLYRYVSIDWSKAVDIQRRHHFYYLPNVNAI